MNEKVDAQVHYGISIYTEVCLTPTPMSFYLTSSCVFIWKHSVTKGKKMKPKHVDLKVV